MKNKETSIDPINLDALHACSTPCPEVIGYNFENWYVSGGNMCQDIDTIDFLNAEIREENYEC
tara:strand:+ start:144 stop:332 length:189 start_codon:yes stop_codon:yes gene_type:complete